MDLRQQVQTLIEKFFGLPVSRADDFPFTNYHVKSPTGVTLVVIPVQFANNGACQLAISTGFGGFDCPLRQRIDALKS